MSNLDKSLLGSYTLTEQKQLIHSKDSLSLLLKTRRKPTKQKPKHYLVQVIYTKDRKPTFNYISSIYNTPYRGFYTFDYIGTNYSIQFSSESAIITNLNQVR